MREIDLEVSTRNWQSVRTLLEAMILAGILGLAYSTQEQTKATIALNVKMTDMAEEVRSLRTQLGDMPALARAITKTEVRLDEHERRINGIEHEQRAK